MRQLIYRDRSSLLTCLIHTYFVLTPLLPAYSIAKVAKRESSFVDLAGKTLLPKFQACRLKVPSNSNFCQRQLRQTHS
jgi:hypothetical protein